MVLYENDFTKIIISTYIIMYQSFAFTVRPLLGVPEDSALEQDFISIFRKNPGFICAEKSGPERHLHGQVFFKKGKRKYDFNRDFLIKICKKNLDNWDPQQERVLKSGTKIAYNNDFYTEYCNKSDSVILVDNFPIDALTYYPTQEEQDKVRARANAKDAKYHHLSELWDEYASTRYFPTLQNVATFMYHIMFISKTYNVIEDPRRRSQTTKALLEYLLADESRALRFMLPEEEHKRVEINNLMKTINAL